MNKIEKMALSREAHLSLRSSYFIGRAAAFILALLLSPSFGGGRGEAALAQTPNLLVCAGKGYIIKSGLVAGGTSPITYTWQENGQDMGSGYSTDAINIPAGKAPGLYTYVRTAANAECPDGIASNAFTVQVLQPAAPVISVGTAAICQGAADLVFTIPPAAHTTYSWSGAPGAPSGDDHSTYTVSDGAAGAIAVRAAASVTYHIGSLPPKVCVSDFSDEASATVHPHPVITPASGTQCGSHALLSVQVAVGGVPVSADDVTITWYADEAGVTSVGSGATYAPVLTSGATYYAGATLTATGCAATSLTPIDATVHLYEGSIDVVKNPAVVHGATCFNKAVSLYASATDAEISWYDSETGETSLHTGNTYTTPTLSTSATYYVQARYTASGAVTMRVPVVATVHDYMELTQTSGAQCSSHALLSVAANLTDATITWYADEAGNTPVNTGAIYTPVLTASATYYAGAAVTATGCATSGLIPVYAPVNLYEGSIAGVKNPAVVHGSRCSSGTVSLSAAATGAEIEWYDAETGGAPLHTGNTYTTPTLSASATYYAQARYTATGAVTMRVPVVATVFPLPEVSQVASGAQCGSSVLLTVQVMVDDVPVTGSEVAITWYADEAGNTTLGSGATYTTVLTAGATYYAGAVVAATGCAAAALTPIDAPMNLYEGTIAGVKNPAVVHGERCGSGTVELGASATGAEIDWYDSETGGASLHTGNTFTTPELSESATYYAQARYTASGALTMRVPVVATVILDAGAIGGQRD